MLTYQSSEELESLWDALLSRKTELIRQIFNTLEKSEQQSILTHLQRMTSEPGWHPEQAASARAALEALKE
jgi:hypothetical protein